MSDMLSLLMSNRDLTSGSTTKTSWPVMVLLAIAWSRSKPIWRMSSVPVLLPFSLVSVRAGLATTPIALALRVSTSPSLSALNLAPLSALTIARSLAARFFKAWVCVTATPLTRRSLARTV